MFEQQKIGDMMEEKISNRRPLPAEDEGGKGKGVECNFPFLIYCGQFLGANEESGN